MAVAQLAEHLPVEQVVAGSSPVSHPKVGIYGSFTLKTMDKRLIRQLLEVFRRHKIVFAYLFGSQAKGKTGGLSDIDLAVYFSEEVPAKDYFKARLALLGDLVFLFKKENIDLVVLNEAPPLLAHRILKHGRLIFSDDEKIRVEYETKAVLKYLDWKPYLDKYTKEVFSIS